MYLIKYCLSLLSLSLLIMLISCEQVMKDSELTIIKPLNIASPLNVDISEIVDSISYIPLETAENSILRHAQKVVFADSRLFVNDGIELKSFNYNGEFISVIGCRGNGPAEYINIDAFFIDELNDNVGIVCGVTNKILYYNYNGVYQYSASFSDIKDANVINQLEVLPDGDLLAHYRLPSYAFPIEAQYKILHVNKNGDIDADNSLDESKLNTKDSGIHPYMYYSMAEYGGYLGLSPMSDIIWLYDSGDMIPKYRVITNHEIADKKFIKNNWTGSVPEFFSKALDGNKSPGLLRIHSTEDYLFVADSYHETIVWDGKDAITLGNVSHMDLNIGGGVLVSGLSDNCLGTYNPAFLLNSKDKISDDKLLNIIANLEYESNPIVFRYHFKKNLIDILKKRLQENEI